jgi:hypothetical protein
LLQRYCDFCGDWLDEDSYFEIETCHATLDVGFSYDLCPACHTIVTQWLTNFTRDKNEHET